MIVASRSKRGDDPPTLRSKCGFIAEQITYRFQGRDFRITEVHGKIVKEILA